MTKTPKLSATLNPRLLSFCQPFSDDPRLILTDGKLMAKALAEAAPPDVRLALARSFCTAVIESYWSRLQRDYAAPWPLPAPFEQDTTPAIHQPGASLATALGEAAARLDPIHAGYLIGVIYTAMIPDEMRSRFGVFYTPPALTYRLLDMATAAGVAWDRVNVLDPACGGGAFLAPVAARIVGACESAGPLQIIQELENRIAGFEIDPFAAWMSQTLLESSVLPLCQKAGRRLTRVVEVCDSLLRPAKCNGTFGLVIGNPPYGRVSLAAEVRARYSRGLYGHANLYSLFTDAAIQFCQTGGVIAYLTPTSFLAGEYFKALRLLITREAPPANIDFVVARKGVFEDALQETALTVYRRGAKPGRATVHYVSPTSDTEIDLRRAGTFRLSSEAGSPWLIPRTPEQTPIVAALRKLRHTLADYGYRVSTGPLVWNRFKDQLAARPAKDAYPLIWAESITSDGRFVFRADKKNHQPYFRARAGDDWLICRKPCVLVQRTTAKEQSRRLIAAEMPGSFLEEHGAAVVENHLNMLLPLNGKPAVPPAILAVLLNSDIVDQAFRCLSGSVAVSAYEMEALPLPDPRPVAALQKLISRQATRGEIEQSLRKLFMAPETA